MCTCIVPVSAHAGPLQYPSELRLHSASRCTRCIWILQLYPSERCVCAQGGLASLGGRSFVGGLDPALRCAFVRIRELLDWCAAGLVRWCERRRVVARELARANIEPTKVQPSHTAVASCRSRVCI
jgi:hypothetical protein